MEDKPRYDIKSNTGYKVDAIEFSTDTATPEWEIKFTVFKDNIFMMEWTVENGMVERLSEKTWLLKERVETLEPNEYQYAMLLKDGLNDERVLMKGNLIVSAKV